MKSSRLSFNTAIARNTLRRCWPLWAAYLGFLLVTFPLPLLSEIRTARERSGLLYACRDVIGNMAVFQALAGMAVAVLTVMLLFGYLYNGRGNTLMNSLPIRRESLFLTLYLTGLIPMLLCELLVMGLTMLMTAAYDIGTVWFLRWFACAALGFLAFYGFALLYNLREVKLYSLIGLVLICTRNKTDLYVAQFLVLECICHFLPQLLHNVLLQIYQILLR